MAICYEADRLFAAKCACLCVFQGVLGRKAVLHKSPSTAPVHLKSDSILLQQVSQVFLSSLLLASFCTRLDNNTPIFVEQMEDKRPCGEPPSAYPPAASRAQPAGQVCSLHT